MKYMIIHMNGKHKVNYPLDQLAKVLSELDKAEDIESCVALTHDSEWCLSMHPEGYMLWENNLGELDECWFMEDVSAEKAIELWTLLAKGEIDVLKEEPWVAGDPIYGE
ncbi:MAG: hypothetical protein HRU38_03870 [Saccharospirillaceae bacterium]|nr:hypothetical protein [Pseudomonadales bacterium]NRB77802.1 hypothetical protein [Saccharospirillaceae bacterium]